jgi:hypothetical protein
MQTNHRLNTHYIRSTIIIPLNKITHLIATDQRTSTITVPLLLYARYCMHIVTFMLLCILLPDVTLKNSSFTTAVYLCVLCNYHRSSSLSKQSTHHYELRNSAPKSQ